MDEASITRTDKNVPSSLLLSLATRMTCAPWSSTSCCDDIGRGSDESAPQGRHGTHTYMHTFVNKAARLATDLGDGLPDAAGSARDDHHLALQPQTWRDNERAGRKGSAPDDGQRRAPAHGRPALARQHVRDGGGGSDARSHPLLPPMDGTGRACVCCCDEDDQPSALLPVLRSWHDVCWSF